MVQASPEAEAPAPAMPPKDEEPGFWASLGEQKKRKYMHERNERLKTEIQDQIQARVDKKEADRIAKEEADRIATAALAGEQPEQSSFEEPKGGAAPFNAFGASEPVAPTMANVKEEPHSESDDQLRRQKLLL